MYICCLRSENPQRGRQPQRAPPFKPITHRLRPPTAQARQEALDAKTLDLLIPPAAVVRTRLLGRGGCGEVYEGVWQGTTPVALKQLPVGVMSERDRMDLQREALIHSRAHNHPNVCRLYGLVLAAPDQCTLVLELHNGSLRQLLRDNDVALPSRQRYSLALDVARGMEHLHARRIVHGDLKPGNVLVHGAGPAGRRAVVSDFGLSSISCVSLSTVTAVATAAATALQSASAGMSFWYSPPELLDNHATAHAAAGDVYAFGVVLWEVFTRREPYGVAQYDAVLRVVLGGGRPALPDGAVPAACAELIARCWQQEPGARPSFAEVASCLEGLLAGCS
jgi:serine/threonine protein kinase